MPIPFDIVFSFVVFFFFFAFDRICENLPVLKGLINIQISGNEK